MSSGLLFGSVEAVDLHSTGRGHPERPARLAAVTRGIDRARDHIAVEELSSRAPRRDELVRVHDDRYLLALAELAAAGGGELDPDTPTSAGSYSTALAAAGLGLAAVDTLRAGVGDTAFVACRPPGHHAMSTRGMGFCLLNNVAVAAASIAETGERVAIIDWDVHHGNGTQAIFWNDPRVLYVSTHEWPAYPGTGAAHETGGPGAPGTTINIPLPAGSTGDVTLLAFDEVVAPAVDDFAPDWILISAGFDPHRADPLADLAWSAGDFADLATRVIALAPGRGRVVAFLEGGYDLEALETSVAATATALGGVRYRPEPSTNGGPGRDSVRSVAEARIRAKEVGP